MYNGHPIIALLSRINQIHRSDTYIFKVHANIVFHVRLRLPESPFTEGLHLKALLPSYILAT